MPDVGRVGVMSRKDECSAGLLAMGVGMFMAAFLGLWFGLNMGYAMRLADKPPPRGFCELFICDNLELPK